MEEGSSTGSDFAMATPAQLQRKLSERDAQLSSASDGKSLASPAPPCHNLVLSIIAHTAVAAEITRLKAQLKKKGKFL